MKNGRGKDALDALFEDEGTMKFLMQKGTVEDLRRLALGANSSKMKLSNIADKYEMSDEEFDRIAEEFDKKYK